MLTASALRFVGFVSLTTAGAGAPTGVSKSNVTVPALGTGTGDISITLGQGGVDKAQCVVFKAEKSATALTSTIVHTSDTVKQILGWNAAGAAADVSVSLAFFQLDASQSWGPGPIQPNDLMLIAGCILTTNGAGAPVIIQNFNCTIGNGTGTGDQNITLGEGGVDEQQCVIAKWDEGAAGQISSIIHTSDTVKQILIFNPNGDAAVDGTVGVFFFRPAAESYRA